MSCKKSFFIFLSLFLFYKIKAFDQSLFYQARFFPGEPRFERDWLTQVMLRGAGGATNKQTDGCGILTPPQICTRYRVNQLIADVTQNLCRGWFVNVTLPLYHIHILPSEAKSNNFVSLHNMNITGGWTINYEETDQLDFIDVTLETGVILPTAKRRAQSKGVIFRGAAAVGVYDWISAGLQADIVTFTHDHNGRLWNVNWYLKADHVIRGLSLLAGYSHSSQVQTPVPWSKQTLPSWSMDTLHIAISYDTAGYDHSYTPSIEFFYNHVLSGKNIIKNSICGIALSSCF